MKKSFTLIFFALLAVTSIVSAQSTTDLTKLPRTTLFQTDDNANFLYRIPSIARLHNGSLMAFTDRRNAHGAGDIGRGNTIDVLSCSSSDNGITWTDAKVALQSDLNANNFGYAYGDAATVVDRETGKILMMNASGRNGFSTTRTTNPIRIAHSVSTDNGLTWTTTDVSDSIYKSTGLTMAFFSSGRICQSSQIKVGKYYRIYSAAPCTIGTDNIGVQVFYSDDFGDTWNLLGGTSARPAANGNESKIEELPNGNVVLSCRTNPASDGSNVYGRYFNIFTYTDKEKATGTWGTAVLSASNTGTYAGEVDGEILLVPAKNTSGNDVYILLQSVAHDGGGLNSTRKNVGIYYKVLSSPSDYDKPSDFQGGWTWRQISNTYSAYSTMVLDKNGNIAFFFEENLKNGGMGYDMQFMSLPLSTITEGKYTYDATRDPSSDVVAAPVISPNGGAITDAVKVSMSCFTNGATIYYTTDGSDPTTLSTKYSEPFVVKATTTVKAIAVKGEEQSEVTSATFTLVDEVFQENVLPVDGGVYTIHAYLASSASSPAQNLYVHNDNGSLKATAISDASQVSNTANYLWVCSKASDGTYYFSSLDGEGYIGRSESNGDHNAAFSSNYNDVLDIINFQKSVNNGTNMTGYAIQYYRMNSTSNSAIVSVSDDGEFDRMTTSTDNTYSNIKNKYYTTDFIFNKVPYSSTSTDYGTLAAPVHHGVTVKFARSDDGKASDGDYNYYATLNLPFAVNLPEGVTAYKINSLRKGTGETIDMTAYLKGGVEVVLPRETPVLLQMSGAEGNGVTSKAVNIKPAGHQENVNTGFAGTLGKQVFTDYNETTGASDGIYYILAKKNGKVAFYYLVANNNGEMAMAKNKAYYKYVSSTGAKPAFLSFSFGDTPTAIKGITDRKSSHADAWYDLQGRRVTSPHHGIYIKDGKKVVLP